MLNKAKTSLSSIAMTACLSLGAQAADITGAGASFVYPAMSKWSSDYNKATKNKVNYQSIGSGGGIAQIKAATVDFGSSDAPLKVADLQASNLAQFPSVMGAVVPVVNVPGLKPGSVKFTGPILADIFLGKITKWNDPTIAAVNAGVTFPDMKITVVHRSDGSGTTFNFVNYLSKVNLDWREKVGEGTSVKWPVGIGGKGNELSELLRRWFGNNAGLPGTDFKVVFELQQGQWRVSPLDATHRTNIQDLPRVVDDEVGPRIKF